MNASGVLCFSLAALNLVLLILNVAIGNNAWVGSLMAVIICAVCGFTCIR